MLFIVVFDCYLMVNKVEYKTDKSAGFVDYNYHKRSDLFGNRCNKWMLAHMQCYYSSKRVA